MFFFFRRHILFFPVLLLAGISPARAQITTSGALTPAQMVQNVLVGGGVTVSNVKYTGYVNGISTFAATANTNLGIGSGIYLTSGSYLATDPINSFSTGTDGPFGPSSNLQSVDQSGGSLIPNGDHDLDSLLAPTNTTSNDAVSLEFDFIPMSDTVQFRYKFASEEYNMYVPQPGITGYNDVFAFFLSCPSLGMPKTNIALLPGSGTAVSIFTVNNGYSSGASAGPCTNCSFYNDNYAGTINTAYNGLTTLLTAKALVKCGVLYHIKIALADAGDHVVDSGVFLEAGSFGSASKVATTLANVSCNGANNGSITATVNGGAGPFTYSWSPSGGTGPTASGLSPGTYILTVKDGGGCKLVDTLVVTQPPVLALSTSATSTTCGAANGSLSSIASGGTMPYAYSWNTTPPQNTAAPTQVVAGTYMLTVTDSKGCQTTSSSTVQPSVAIALNPMAPVSLCLGQCSALPATVNGGVPGYTYNWASNGTPVVPPVCPVVNTNYTLTVKDAAGCSTSPGTVAVTVSPPLHLTAPPPVSYCSGGSATLQAIATGGAGTLTYSWSPATGLSSTSVVNPLDTVQTSTTYTLVVNDACGIRPDTAVVTVTVNPAPHVTLQASDTLGCVPLCVNFAMTSTTPCSGIVWNFGDSSKATGCGSVTHCYDSAGLFTVNMSLTDVHNCKAVLNHIHYIHTLPTPEASFSYFPNPVTLLNPEVTFSSVPGGTSSISWDFGDSPSSVSHVQNPHFVYRDTGCYQVSLLLENTAGCSDTARARICIKAGFSFYAPSAFTPNGDGHNDVWMPVGSGISASNYELIVFDRWGNLIFETHTLGDGWDGRANNGPSIAQIDTYIWKVTLKDVDGQKHAYSGVCNLIR